MEKISRVKKYEDLRKSIETDNNIDMPHSEEEQQPKELLSSFDSSIFKKAEIQEEDAAPKRAREIEDTQRTVSNDVNDTFTNEYLDDFIKEVREYNIRKGNRESEDTEVDILYQLNAANRAKRTHYVQEIQEDTPELAEQPKTVLSKEEIALEVQNLLKEEPVEDAFTAEPAIENEAVQPDVEPIVHTIDTYEQPKEAHPEDETVQPQKEEEAIKKIVTPVYVDEDDDETVEIDDTQESSTYHKKLIEETQQLRVQMDEYEEELTDLSDGVEKTNKLLNFILCFLILVLLVVIGFIAYSIWKAGGFNL